ncbi:cupin domain-containing protein [Streptosporangiaceae bacterium NEAU-GS5]|nr:cupin domain-containing protein [Streptosporangiaceae bacterium NEAU-GS5]
MPLHNPIPYLLAAGEGDHIRGPAGGPAVFKARGKDTGGSFTALENEIAPLQGPPLHRHPGEDEMYYVLDGLLRFVAGEREFEAATGGFVFIPRGTPHCFQNVGAAPARLLVMFTPSGMERFFEAQATLPPGPIDQAAFHEIAALAAMEVLGPPLQLGSVARD